MSKSNQPEDLSRYFVVTEAGDEGIGGDPSMGKYTPGRVVVEKAVQLGGPGWKRFGFISQEDPAGETSEVGMLRADLSRVLRAATAEEIALARTRFYGNILRAEEGEE